MKDNTLNAPYFQYPSFLRTNRWSIQCGISDEPDSDQMSFYLNDPLSCPQTLNRLDEWPGSRDLLIIHNPRRFMLFDTGAKPDVSFFREPNQIGKGASSTVCIDLRVKYAI